MAIPLNNQSTCQNLVRQLRNIRAKIDILERGLADDENRLERGLENRVRRIIENGQLREKPRLSDQELQREAELLRRNIENTRNQLQDAQHRRDSLISEFDRLGCQRWVNFF